MYLTEVFDQLSEGELAQTSLAEITEAKWPGLVLHINMGLADLFKRFFLREGRLKLQMLSGQTSYAIDAKYAVANRRSRIPTEERFILDSASAPFLNDVLKVERVLTEGGDDLVLNDTGSPWPVLATDTSPVTLDVAADIVGRVQDLPEHLKTNKLEVVYRARHPKIDVQAPSFDPELYVVKLPDSHLQALCYYVAARVGTPQGTGQWEGTSGNHFWQRYEAECTQLGNAGLQIERADSYDKLSDRGFA